MVCSFERVNSFFIRGIEVGNFHEYFDAFFSKYESIPTLSKSVLNFNDLELEVLMHIYSGKNIRSYEALPFPISKKESYHFVNSIQKDVEFSSDALAKMIIVSKIITYNLSST